MEKILRWNSVAPDRWTCSYSFLNTAYIAYKLVSLPNFTDRRFTYISEENSERAAEVAKKQQNMIRRLHGLGENWGISLRLVRNNERITLYLIFRYSGNQNIAEEEIRSVETRIKNALPQEYSFEKLSDAEIKSILDLSWAKEAVEITKRENEFRGDEYPTGDEARRFYCSWAWVATDNDMESICSALLKHPTKSAVEVTICSTEYLDDEQSWIGTSINTLRECMNGETLKSHSTGKVLWVGRKLPNLKPPMENYEKIQKQYINSRMFLTSIRAYAEQDVQSIAESLLVGSVKNEGSFLKTYRGQQAFSYLESCYANVDISSQLRTEYWRNNGSNLPLRAQRLHRLCSAEEIGSFFRIPIPTKSGFPGFLLDTGLGSVRKKTGSRSKILLGNYLDEGDGKTPASFETQQLAKHGLLVGVPGSGKTTAMFNILDQLWNVPNELKIPFIVLEPAKTEYRALTTLPEFKNDMLVFTLGDESVSPFRFNPMEVLPGLPLELHMSRLQACFIGAFDLFDPLPVFLEQAIRRTYEEKGWYSDSVGGEPGVETPTLSDLCRNAEYIVEHSGFDSRMASNFKTSLLERLNSLRRGSKGRMLDTKQSIPVEDLMNKPIILELDSLNGGEKTLMMMFLLTYVFEYCKIARKSGSPLKHMLLVEEAHNLIGSGGSSSENRADPRAQTIELFINMLAEMRALGQGILIADQLPTAIASQAVKQTNVKIMMRVTAKDDREEMGNTMDLNDEQMHQVINFKTGHAYVYHEGEDRVRMLRMVNFKDDHEVEEPPSNEEIAKLMSKYEQEHSSLFMPYQMCSGFCERCDKRVRSQAESFVARIIAQSERELYRSVFPIDTEAYMNTVSFCALCLILTKREAQRIKERYGLIGESFCRCVYIHILNSASKQMDNCIAKNRKKCLCSEQDHCKYCEKYETMGKDLVES